MYVIAPIALTSHVCLQHNVVVVAWFLLRDGGRQQISQILITNQAPSSPLRSCTAMLANALMNSSDSIVLT